MSTVDTDTLLEWVERWGDHSFDDLSPDMQAMTVANRIIAWNGMEETVERTDDPNRVYEELAGMVAPVLKSMDGWMPTGSRWFADQVRLTMMTDDGELRHDGEQAGQDSEQGFPARMSFAVVAAAMGENQGLGLDEIITLATRDYLNTGMGYDGFSDRVRETWLDAAAFDWHQMMRGMETRSVGESCDDTDRLAVLAVAMEFAPEATSLMIARDMLDANAPLAVDELRRMINVPGDQVNADNMFAMLIDDGREVDHQRIAYARGVLDPLIANAPTESCYRFMSVRAMLDMSDGRADTAYELANEAIAYDPDDRIASCILDRVSAPVAVESPMMGMERMSGHAR